MRDQVGTPVVTEAVERALGRRQPRAGLLPQSDRGAQSASHASRGLLAAPGMACSMRGKGDGRDQAVAERVCGRLTRERTSKRSDRTRQEARADLIDDMELFSNRWRKHSYRGDGSPKASEKIGQAA